MTEASTGSEIHPAGNGYFISGLSKRSGQEQHPALIFTLADTANLACLIKGQFQNVPKPALTFETMADGSVEMFYAPSGIDAMPVDYGLSWDTLCHSCGTPFVDLPADTRLCPGNKLRLDAGPGRTRIIWSNGTKGRYLDVSVPGTYWVEAENSCGIASDTIKVEISSEIQPEIQLSSSDILPGDTFVISDATPKSAAVQRTWHIDDSMFSSGADSIRYAFRKNGRHTITLELEDSFGCVFTQSINININFHSLYLPNAFTPTSDNLNEIFAPQGYGMNSYRMQVFNRWGEMVFDEENKGWNGRFRNTPSPEGMYHYGLHIQYDDGRSEFRKGVVHVIYH